MTIDYTSEEFDEFSYLVEMTSSQDQMDRIEARLEMPRFIEKHGKDKCDIMFEEMTRYD